MGERGGGGGRGAGRGRAIVPGGARVANAVNAIAEGAGWGSPVAEDDETVSFFDRGTGTYLDYDIERGVWIAEVPNPFNEDNPFIREYDTPPRPGSLFEEAMGVFGQG